MAPAEGSSRPAARILVALEVLMVDDPERPRAAAEASVALDRLGTLGEPVVVVGSDIAGRQLPDDPERRVAWVRMALDRPRLAVALFDEPEGERTGDGKGRPTSAERWQELASGWGADRLFTQRASSVGPARRAGLEVVWIGPQPGTVAASVERPNHEARDLLEGVRILQVDAAFETVDAAGPTSAHSDAGQPG